MVYSQYTSGYVCFFSDLFLFKYFQIFTLVFVVFLNPFLDFDNVVNLLNLLVYMQVHACASRIKVPDNIYVTIGEDKCFIDKN